jgi:hypothetical protein
MECPGQRATSGIRAVSFPSRCLLGSPEGSVQQFQLELSTWPFIALPRCIRSRRPLAPSLAYSFLSSRRRDVRRIEMWRHYLQRNLFFFKGTAAPRAHTSILKHTPLLLHAESQEPCVQHDRNECKACNSNWQLRARPHVQRARCGRWQTSSQRKSAALTVLCFL